MKDTIRHYRVVRELGRGGMGEVYLAEDTRLHRMVALKILSSEVARDERRVQRFLREAHAVSVLNHPNIAVIYEVGESEEAIPFIAMEYVEGQTLAALISSKPLELNRIVDLGLEIADALDEAKTKGVVHRDLKPSNIVINARGHAKVLDFGLAKLIEEAAASDTAAKTDLKSDPGLVLGTVHYMSPEQALGKEVDHRSDLFSFGVILFEMATAKHPFGAGNTTAIIERIVHSQPDSVARLNYDVPPELERIIRKCLEKDREWRYQSAREIVVDLRSLRRDSGSGERAMTPPPPPRRKTPRIAIAAILGAVVLAAVALWALKNRTGDRAPVAMTSIAVLPFSSVVPNPSMDHLRFALPDEVTTILSYNSSVAVRPFASTRRLADSDPVEAGRTLKVEKVVTGSYRDDHGKLGVTVEAIDVGSNRVVWRNHIDIASSELISLRTALSNQVRAGLLPALGVADQGGDSARPSNLEAYTLFLKAVSASSDLEPSREAREMLERAVELDPNYASAWVELARRHYYEANYGEGGRESMVKARAAARRARALDPESILPARALTIYDAEGGDISSAYRQALELVRRRPRNADAHFVLGYVYRYAGQLDDAARECDTAYSLDPNPSLRSCALTFIHLGDYKRAREFTRLEEGSEWSAIADAMMLIREKRMDEAMAVLQKVRSPRLWGGLIARCRDKAKFDAESIEQQVLAGIDPEPMYFAAGDMAVCGEPERALRILRKSLELGYSIYPSIDSDPPFNDLRRHPEFVKLRADAIRHRDRLHAELAQIK